MTETELSSIKKLAKIISLAIVERVKLESHEQRKNFRKNTEPDLLSNSMDAFCNTDLGVRTNV